MVESSTEASPTQHIFQLNHTPLVRATVKHWKEQHKVAADSLYSSFFVFQGSHANGICLCNTLHEGNLVLLRQLQLLITLTCFQSCSCIYTENQDKLMLHYDSDELDLTRHTVLLQLNLPQVA